ncbi:MAG: DUF1343 domain-containing protein [Ferruginibacter sp.]|nr:DUF1343 domain-containing protein [Ferruginibacter sp.]
MKYCFLLISSLILVNCTAHAQQNKIIPGAERMEEFIPLLKEKRVGVFANQTSMVGNIHLIDALLKQGIQVIKIFSPEHGFRGTANAGESVKSGKDPKTGLPIISLYGNHKRPTEQELADIDVLVFDIQDVGVRFYTYISSLEEIMEAAFIYNKPLMLLDRPNPNGFYIDGPVLEKSYRSFVGYQSVPVVYGMTIAEYALMIAGEGWLSPQANKNYTYYLKSKPTKETPFHFQVIKCLNYDHSMRYNLPVNPSPNLPDMQAIYWYPTTCLFEGTILSEGRGTPKPFQWIGHPRLPKTLFSFSPKPNAGAKSSKHYNQSCYGWDLSNINPGNQLNLQYLLDAYQLFPGKDSFFLKNNFFNKLAGNATLMQQIKNGLTEKEIRNSWTTDLDHFKILRKKYLLYKDFD